jgi:hypothetical protein
MFTRSKHASGISETERKVAQLVNRLLEADEFETDKDPELADSGESEILKLLENKEKVIQLLKIWLGQVTREARNSDDPGHVDKSMLAYHLRSILNEYKKLAGRTLK